MNVDRAISGYVTDYRAELDMFLEVAWLPMAKDNILWTSFKFHNENPYWPYKGL